MTCTPHSDGTLTVTSYWTASGGQYLISAYPGSMTMVQVIGGSRTWTETAHIIGWYGGGAGLKNGDLTEVGYDQYIAQIGRPANMIDVTGFAQVPLSGC